MNRKFTIISLIFCLTMSLMFIGCQKSDDKKVDDKKVDDKKIVEKEPEKEEVLTIKDVYPLNEGDYWKFAGEGNEYAGFEQKVLYREGNKVQLKVTNQGSSVGMVYEYKDGKLCVVYSREDFNDDENLLDNDNELEQVILAEPIKKGNSWESENKIFKITSLNEKVKTPAGEFENCIKIVITAEDEPVNNIYYKPGLGLIKQEYIGEDYSVVSSLEEYEIATYK